jgi:hypothetical protein
VASKAVTEKDGLSIPISAIIIVLVAILGVGLFLFLESEAQRPRSAPPPITAEAKAYVRNLKLMEVAIKAHESYLKQLVVEIVGKIGNQGDRTLGLVEINCVFYDAYGQVVLRERVPIVSRKMGNLAPGEIKNFRLAFDNIPESWNQDVPQLVIARIDFSTQT